MKTLDAYWSFRSPYSYLAKLDMHDALITALPEAEQVVFPEAGHASYVEYPKLFQKQVEVLAKKVWKPKQSNSKINNNLNIFREE